MAGVPPPGRLPGGQTNPRPDVIGDLSRCRRWRGSHAVINDHRPPAQLVVVGRVIERPPAVPLGDRYRTATLVPPAPGSPALPVLPIPSDSLTVQFRRAGRLGDVRARAPRRHLPGPWSASIRSAADVADADSRAGLGCTAAAARGYGTGVGRSAAATAAGDVHGFPAALTSFVGRAGAVREVAGLLDQYRLVTVTGPGGSGKTRLAGEVARQVAGRFADGVWLAELAAVRDPALVAAAVAAALGIREQPGVPVADVLARVLARQQLLLVLDNCEHVIGAAAQLCAGLLAACDDVRVLATSREPLAVAGEARYRLAPLTLPAPGDPADGERRRRWRCSRTGPGRPTRTSSWMTRPGRWWRGWWRGWTGCRWRSSWRRRGWRRWAWRSCWTASMTGSRCWWPGDRLAAGRQRSLAATVEWSYQLLDEHERRVFRQVSVFPGPFTLEAAEAVAGHGRRAGGAAPGGLLAAGPAAGRPDGRARYVMLETLRAYGAGLLAETGEQEAAAAALAGYALRVAEQAAAGLQTSTGEVAAARRLDAEDATMRQVLAWAMEHDAALALRLAVALAPWYGLRGRLPGHYPLLREAARRAEPGRDAWCTAQFWLGRTAFYSSEWAEALGHFTAVRDAVGVQGPSRALADCLAGRSGTLAYLGRIAEAADDGRRALALAREIGDPAGEALVLGFLTRTALEAGDSDGGLQLARQAEQVTADIPGWIARTSGNMLTAALIEVGDLAAAERSCAAWLAQARDAGDLQALPRLLIRMATLDLQAGRIADATSHLHEAVQIAVVSQFALLPCLDRCGYLCAATGRATEAVTVWAAYEALARHEGFIDTPPEVRQRQEPLRQARQALGPARARAAEDRGAAMSRATAAEYALMLTAPGPQPTACGAGAGEAQRPGTGAGHPGRPGPHQRPDRRPAVHQRPHGRLPPGPDPGQDRLPPPRRPDPPGPDRGPGLARACRLPAPAPAAPVGHLPPAAATPQKGSAGPCPAHTRPGDPIGGSAGTVGRPRRGQQLPRLSDLGRRPDILGRSSSTRRDDSAGHQQNSQRTT